MADADLSRTVRFGLFELDLRASELRQERRKDQAAGAALPNSC
jgi:hypothetical protein